MVKRIRQLKKMGEKFEEATECERMQLAMLVDTDGSINPTEHQRPHIKVSGRSELPVMMWKKWGGYIAKSYVKGGKRIEYEWEINERKRVKAFLLMIEPHLMIKQPQARIALEMINLLENKPEGYKQELKLLSKELSRLNHAPAPDIDLEEDL